jgi:trehalose 6-phosphate phosphatase
VRPTYLFSRPGSLPRPILKSLAGSREIVLLMDYDGTLVPIQSAPKEARLSSRTRQLLNVLSDEPKIISGIVTGRSLPDILRKVGRNRFLLLANHGFEIFIDNDKWVHPWAERMEPLLRRLARTLRRRLKTVSGLLLENKGYTLSVHYRRVSQDEVREVRDTVMDVLRPYVREIRITKGKKVIELRPNVPWSKGTAILKVLRLLKRQKKRCIIYLGDDTTDEDAFEALRGSGITIAVGKKKKSSAAYWVKDPAEVMEFLSILAFTVRERDDQ